MASDAGRWLRAGRVGRPHGLDGSFHVREPVPMLLVLGVEVVVEGRRTRVVRRAGDEQRPIVRLDGFEGRAAIEALVGGELLVARDDAPELEDDEWWADDLAGCQVYDGEREVGTVTRLVALPSCEVLEVARTGEGGELLVPLVSDAVRAVDVERRRIDVDLRFLGAR
jgi:16S rRNA processing protein RimM